MTYAIITDIHGNLEALNAVLKDIKKRNIDKIICLGDVVGIGPYPSECLDLIINNNVQMIAGNAEEYCIFGADAFPYLKNPEARYENAVWTRKQLREDQLDYLTKLPHSIDIDKCGYKIGLCHFPVDVRYDYSGVSSYLGKNTNKFYITNTKKDLRFKLSNALTEAANKDPLFGGKKIKYYDIIIYGHYHFYKYHHRFGLKFYSINGTGVGINKCATYQIVTITEKGFNTHIVNVPYDKDKLLKSIANIDFPNKDRFIKYISNKDIL